MRNSIFRKSEAADTQTGAAPLSAAGAIHEPDTHSGPNERGPEEVIVR